MMKIIYIIPLLILFSCNGGSLRDGPRLQGEKLVKNRLVQSGEFGVISIIHTGENGRKINLNGKVFIIDKLNSNFVKNIKFKEVLFQNGETPVKKCSYSETNYIYGDALFDPPKLGGLKKVTKPIVEVEFYKETLYIKVKKNEFN